MQRVILLHGWAGSPQGNWFPWLKQKLEQKDYQVNVPNLPNADHPQQQVWVKALGKPVGENYPDTILVGHSLGVTTIFRFLETLPNNVQVKAVICVGTPTKNSANNYPPLHNFFDKEFNWEKIKNSVKHWYIIGSNNDQYIPFSEIEHTPKMLGQKLIFLPGEGHFNLEFSPKYKEFPYLLEIFAQIEKNDESIPDKATTRLYRNDKVVAHL